MKHIAFSTFWGVFAAMGTLLLAYGSFVIGLAMIVVGLVGATLANANYNRKR